LKPLADVYDVEIFAAPGAGADTPADLLIEVPHGATRQRHFAATLRRLEGAFPDDLEQFFFVNTDVGSIECARWVARMTTSPARLSELEGPPAAGGGPGHLAFGTVLLLRGLVARTFIDCNRVISGDPAGAGRDGVTPGLPAYVREPDDVRTLKAMHADYQAAAARAYAAVCGGGGRALTLHTYAPRSVRIDNFDEGIVAAMRDAYEPAAVDLITESLDGQRLAPESLVLALRERYASIGVEVAENATYRLHEDTMAYARSMRYPGRVLCMEINRELLADPFTPFAEMSISNRQARRMAAPVAAALLASRSGPV
jgi:hypothetical protein